jgi:hypothetical protein
MAEREHLPIRIAALDVDSGQSVRWATINILSEACSTLKWCSRMGGA